jgi:hypothetical protein
MFDPLEPVPLQQPGVLCVKQRPTIQPVQRSQSVVFTVLVPTLVV